MTIHLPECIYTPERFDPEQNIVWDGKPCICDRLHACEQRVREDCDDLGLIGYGSERGYDDGYAAGVKAARDAVAAWFVANRDQMTWPEALAAIDALWG